MNKLLSDKEAVLADVEILRQTAEDTAGFQGRLDAISAESEEVNGQTDGKMVFRFKVGVEITL